MANNVNLSEGELAALRSQRTQARLARKAINFRRYRRQYIRRSK